MASETWDRLEAVFFGALELPADARSAFLDDACDGDPDLRVEVEALLASHLKVDASDSDREAPERRIGTQVGAYRLEELLGRGGMGEVYRARRADDEYEAEVAVKLVRSGLNPYEMVRRFRIERQILASLDHPNVAPLLDGGVSDDGLPYLVMPYVRGIPVTEYADANRLSVNDRLNLFRTVCGAVQFAHSNLVVHRDLKPSNILVEQGGRVRLLDFGIAKLLDSSGTPASELPTASLLMMTPEHAAPEQFLGQPITTATDVYALGVLLYELLTGTKPFRGSNPVALHRAICEEMPTRPSVASRSPTVEGGGGTTLELADVASARRTSGSGLARRLTGDLDRIVLMALRKDPERRYASAADLSDDVRRHVEGYPVRARPERLGYVASRFVRRHRFSVAATLALGLTLLAFVGSSLRFASTTQRQSAAIEEERDVALEVSAFLESFFEASDPLAEEVRRDTLQVRAFLDEGAAKVRSELRDRPQVQARLLTVLGNAYHNLGAYENARPLLEEAVAVRVAVLGPDAPEVATTQADLAQLLMDLAEYDEAQALLETGRASLARDSVEQRQHLRSVTSTLGTLAMMRGQYKNAEKHYRSALLMAASDSTTEDGAMAAMLSGLAGSLNEQLRLDEAEGVLRRAAELSESAHGPGHLLTAEIRTNLGSVLRKQRRYEEAETIGREVLAVRRERLGDAHPSIATSLNNLAVTLMNQGRHTEAEPFLRENIDMRVALFGPDHPDLSVAWINLGSSLRQVSGREDDAASALGEARRVLLASGGAEHPRMAGVEGHLAGLYHGTGDHARAERHFLQAQRIRRATLGAHHPYTLDTMANRAGCLVRLGRYDEAEAALLESFAGFEPQREEQQAFWNRLLGRLSDLYRRTGRDAEADRYEAMRIR